jgi:hypothetical protein
VRALGVRVARVQQPALDPHHGRLTLAMELEPVANEVLQQLAHL